MTFEKVRSFDMVNNFFFEPSEQFHWNFSQPGQLLSTAADGRSTLERPVRFTRNRSFRVLEKCVTFYLIIRNTCISMKVTSILLLEQNDRFTRASITERMLLSEFIPCSTSRRLLGKNNCNCYEYTGKCKRTNVVDSHGGCYRKQKEQGW